MYDIALDDPAAHVPSTRGVAVGPFVVFADIYELRTLFHPLDRPVDRDLTNAGPGVVR